MIAQSLIADWNILDTLAFASIGERWIAKERMVKRGFKESLEDTAVSLATLFIAFSSRLTPSIRQVFPAIFAADVHDPLLHHVASSEFSNIGGSLR